MEKKIDAVKIVREIRDKHYEETVKMTNEERIKHIKEKARFFVSNLISKV